MAGLAHNSDEFDLWYYKSGLDRAHRYEVS